MSFLQPLHLSNGAFLISTSECSIIIRQEIGYIRLITNKTKENRRTSTHCGRSPSQGVYWVLYKVRGVFLIISDIYFRIRLRILIFSRVRVDGCAVSQAVISYILSVNLSYTIYIADFLTYLCSTFFVKGREPQFFIPTDMFLNPFSTAVPIWGQTTLIPNSKCELSPKRDWGPKRVNALQSVWYTFLCIYPVCRLRAAFRKP